MIYLKNLYVFAGRKAILNGLNLEITKGENLLITGPSGSGKSVLGKIIAGLWDNFSGMAEVTLPQNSIVFIEQQADFSAYYTGRAAYHEQRFDGNEMEQIPLVKTLIKEINPSWQSLFSISELENKRLHQLSNGESKRLQLSLELSQNPKLIILDNPFTGLDATTRAGLQNILKQVSSLGITYILLGKEPEEISSVSKIIYLEEGEIKFKGNPESWFQFKKEKTLQPRKGLITDSLLEEVKSQNHPDFTYALEMEDVQVQYGDKVILKNINWQVKKGECWALTGPNGAGKTTLLSLITADNPQGYQNNFKLFDKQRGTGESIWEIKNKIGFVSPELHKFFEKQKGVSKAVQQSGRKYASQGGFIFGIKTLDAVISGLKDQIGFSKDSGASNKWNALNWLKILGIESLANTYYNSLSLGEQRLVLLARALIKNPPLLILDEPCQGLDETQTERFKSVVNHVCTSFGKTLIYVSHYENEIPECVTKKLILENGSVLQKIT